MKKSRVAAGSKAKSNGKQFEKLLELQLIKKNWAVIRIPDGSRQISQTQIIRVKSPFDFCIARLGQVFFFDAKSTDAKSWSYSMNNEKQLDKLLSLEAEWQKAGYIVWFKSTNRVVFFPSSLLKSMKPRESLKDDQGYYLGPIEDVDMGKAHSFQPRGLIDVLTSNSYQSQIDEIPW